MKRPKEKDYMSITYGQKTCDWPWYAKDLEKYIDELETTTTVNVGLASVISSKIKKWLWK